MRPQQDKRADRIGAPQREFFAVFVSQRFRDENVAVEPIRQAKPGRNPERQTRNDVCQRSANSGTQNKAETKRQADHTECASASYFRDNLVTIRHANWDIRSVDSVI